ncbi:hypothetical protein CPB86DRAFT_58198 [Serendipita vermifera]|nr:hypothetical protein CPB86DRAFT_58198 [Serendipita vermifera]
MNASFDLPIPHPRSCPTADEVLLYKGRITSINEQIDETQNQVLELERKRSNYASYISPLRCLPTEILGQIIHLCLNHGVDLATLIQICGTVRDVAIRMTKIWNRIRVGGFSRVYSKKYVISCRNREQLDFVLSCAGSTPLELYLDGVVEPQLVEAISSVNYPIESLTIDNPRPQTIKFANLNMRELKRLYFKGMEYNDIKELMDVAIQSVNKEMSLGMGLWRRGTPLALQHPLLLRVVDLSLSSELNEFSGPFNLPRLRSLDIKGRPALFSAFDLRNEPSGALIRSTRVVFRI